MKILAAIFALLALASGFKIETKRAQLIPLAKINQCGPDETPCPTHCCPFGPNWYCCVDDIWLGCAPTAAECPFVAKRVSLVKMAKISQCGPDETSCPNGCCPMPGWFCCFDSVYCAATVDDCRFDAEKTQLMDLAKSTYCDDNDQLLCPNGWCCPEPDWFCCPDDWCSPTPADCPWSFEKEKKTIKFESIFTSVWMSPIWSLQSCWGEVWRSLPLCSHRCWETGGHRWECRLLFTFAYSHLQCRQIWNWISPVKISTNMSILTFSETC